MRPSQKGPLILIQKGNCGSLLFPLTPPMVGPAHGDKSVCRPKTFNLNMGFPDSSHEEDFLRATFYQLHLCQKKARATPACQLVNPALNAMRIDKVWFFFRRPPYEVSPFYMGCLVMNQSITAICSSPLETITIFPVIGDGLPLQPTGANQIFISANGR